MIVRRLRFAAVLVAVVMALTGFAQGSSSGGKGGGSKSGSSKSRKSDGDSSSSSGGGCSSSKKKNGKHSDSDWEEDGAARQPVGAATAASGSGDEATAVVVVCAGPQDDRRSGTRKSRGKKESPRTSATVLVTSKASATRTFTLELDFLGGSGAARREIDGNTVTVTLDARESRRVEVPLRSPRRAADVTACEVDGIRAAG
ncbi:hypothetical protein [Streptomyces sp. NPDC097619]|uniref:hypothetical protein n=1 Tax=Streptomyces sp. NPDC097619 TaxID=3157228 RepID=UPI00332BD0C5